MARKHKTPLDNQIHNVIVLSTLEHCKQMETRHQLNLFVEQYNKVIKNLNIITIQNKTSCSLKNPN